MCWMTGDVASLQPERLTREGSERRCSRDPARAAGDAPNDLATGTGPTGPEPGRAETSSCCALRVPLRHEEQFACWATAVKRLAGRTCPAAGSRRSLTTGLPVGVHRPRTGVRAYRGSDGPGFAHGACTVMPRRGYHGAAAGRDRRRPLRQFGAAATSCPARCRSRLPLRRGCRSPFPPRSPRRPRRRAARAAFSAGPPDGPGAPGGRT